MKTEKEYRTAECEKLIARFRGEDLDLDDLRWFFEQGYNFALIRTYLMKGGKLK